MASDFEAKRIFFSFSFSRSYSNILMNPRCRLLWGFKNIFLRIPKLVVKFIDIRSSCSRHESFSSYCPFNLVSIRSKFDIWIRAVANESPL
jgi:hypothetical protein